MGAICPALVVLVVVHVAVVVAVDVVDVVDLGTVCCTRAKSKARRSEAKQTSSARATSRKIKRANEQTQTNK